MDIILKERGHGKTTNLICMSAQTGIPIVSMQPQYIIELAEKLHVQIPRPISTQEWQGRAEKPQAIYVDELSVVLKKLLGSSVAGFTDTL